MGGLRADTVLIQSGPGGNGTQYNTGVNGAVPLGEANVVLTPPHPAWAPAIGASQWISFVDNYSPTPSGQDPCGAGYLICNGDSVSFFHTFTLTNSASYSGLLQVMADDTADVWLNGVQLFAAVADYTGLYPYSYSRCADVPIGCQSDTTGIMGIDASLLHDGTNTLEFTVWQKDGTGYGLDYSMALSNVPEPGIFGLISGCLGALLALRRKSVA